MNDAFLPLAIRFMSSERRYIAFRLEICSREVGGIRGFPVSGRRTDNRTDQTSVLQGALPGWRLVGS